jgi:hypothetical protein
MFGGVNEALEVRISASIGKPGKYDHHVGVFGEAMDQPVGFGGSTRRGVGDGP